MFPLDHVPFGVSNLESARARLARLGFTASDPALCRWEAGGAPESARATSVVFGESYLDLIENQSPGWHRHLESSQLYRDGFAPSGIVVSTPNLDRSRRELAHRAQRTTPPYAIQRSHPVFDEPPSVDYRIASLEASPLPLALIEDSNPSALRLPAWIDHPNSAVGIEALHLRVPSVAETLAAYEGLGGGDAVCANPPEIRLGTSSLRLYEEPLSGRIAAIGALQPSVERPALLALEIRVTDLERAASCLRQNEIAFDEESGWIAIDPMRGLGCAIWMRAVAAPEGKP